MTTKVVVRHFHDGNDADGTVRSRWSKTGKPALYATVAIVLDLDTGNPIQIKEKGTFCEVWAFCNSKDVPSRSQGRAIAVGRLQKQFPEQCREADFGQLEYLRVKADRS